MLKYVSSTIIEPLQVIQRERKLPHDGELVGTVGQEVTPIQVVGRSQRSAGYELIPASELLRVPPKKVVDYLQVQPGAMVDEGTVLCHKRPFRKIISPIEGRLHGVYNGQLVLERPFIWHELRSLLRGRIISQAPPRSVIIETIGALIQARWGSGKEAFGRLKLLSNEHTGELAVSNLSNSLARHTLAAGHLTDPAVLEQAAELDVAGIILGSAPAALHDQLIAAPFPIVIIDGFGQQGITEPAFRLLKDLENRETTLFGHFESGSNIRPEIIIAAGGAPSQTAFQPAKPLAVGQAVRLMRQPYRQQVGQIIKLYEQAQALETGLYAPGAAVRLGNGTVVFVPDANLDIVQAA